MGFIGSMLRGYQHLKLIQVNGIREELSEPPDAPVGIQRQTHNRLKLSGSAYKKIHRLLLDGWINDTDTPFSVALFGSPDKTRWFLMNASKSFTNGQSLVIGKSSFSCRYFILIAGGNIDELSYFSGIYADIENRYDSKLR